MNGDLLRQYMGSWEPCYTPVFRPEEIQRLVERGHVHPSHAEDLLYAIYERNPERIRHAKNYGTTFNLDEIARLKELAQ